MQAFNEAWVNGILEGWNDGLKTCLLVGSLAKIPLLHYSNIPKI
jgi:hypothetical protein